ncbi:MAG: hypothetical protein RIE31_05130 [Alphaproteobacteria bacterium]
MTEPPFIETEARLAGAASLHIVAFRPHHLTWMQLREPGRSELLSAGASPESLALRGPSVTLADGDGTPVAALGLVPLWPGVAEAWVLTGSRVTGHVHAFHRLVRRHLADAPRRFTLHRIQASVRADSVVARRWALALGFREEGLMPAYGPDQADYHRVAYLPKETHT